MSPRPRFEAWAWPAFALLAGTLGLLLVMGGRPGGELAVRIYLWGPFALGGLSATVLLFGLLWSLRRRPVLQRGRAWPLAALAASLWLCSLPFSYPSSHEGKPSPIRFRLPFEGRARVALPFLSAGRSTGTGRVPTNAFLFDPARRFGVCFEGEGQPLAVMAPAGGQLKAIEPARQGSRLLVEVGPEAFLVLEGVAPAGDAPRPGEPVAVGQPLGSAPGQLFVFLMDGERTDRSEGIPLRFWGYRADGRPVEAGVPIPPQRVESLPGADTGGH